MKAHTKKPEIRFFVRSNPNDSLREVNVGNIINSMQRYYLGEDPVMIYQFAQFAGEELRNRGAKNPEVYAFAKVSLNGRPYYPVVDSTLNLLSVKHDFWKLDNWVLPLKE
jgi:hypothetical protein